MDRRASGVRYAEVERETRETRVRIALDLDEGESQSISTGIDFFDHMLQQLAFHGRLALGVLCEGDLAVDDHHTVEDVGIVLGMAIREALDEAPIERYASHSIPMDDALVLASIDVSGRGGCYFEVPFRREAIGGLSTECVSEFFKSVANHAKITLHLRKLAGENDHHVCEATFKAFGIALRGATRHSSRSGATSTKDL